MPLDLKDTLDLMDTGQWLGIVYVSLDEKRGTAGEIIRLKRCRLASAATGASSSSSTGNLPGTSSGRNPQHGFHSTRNLRSHNAQIRKCHIRLIVAINGKKIV